MTAKNKSDDPLTNINIIFEKASGEDIKKIIDATKAVIDAIGTISSTKSGK